MCDIPCRAPTASALAKTVPNAEGMPRAVARSRGADGREGRVKTNTAAVNDQNNMEAIETYEMMIRYLLERDGNPALIEFQYVSLLHTS